MDVPLFVPLVNQIPRGKCVGVWLWMACGKLMEAASDQNGANSQKSEIASLFFLACQDYEMGHQH